MSLVKRTFVLSDRTPKGYVTFVRVGNESGAKIVGENFKSGMKAYVKSGQKFEIITLTGKRTEAEIGLSLTNTDNMSCMVFDGKEIIATGGKEFSEREKQAILSGNIQSEEQKSEDTEEVLRSVRTEKNEETSQTVITDMSEEKEIMNSESEQAERSGDILPQTIKENEVEIDEKESKENVKDKGTLNEYPKKEEEAVNEETDMLRRLGEEKTGYYLGISDRIDELFVVYPAEKGLSEAIPDSEWVKVNYDGEDYYVVGRLKDNGKVRFLGYGVPGKESVKPPKAADGIAQWFPLSGMDGYDGYWLFFQDAETGKIDG